MDMVDRLSTGLRAWILLFVITAAAAAPGIAALPTLDRDEARFAQASKQMLESGDFIRISYQDEGRNKKPAGIHWLQAGSTALFSSAHAKAIWSYRLPSLIGAAGATLATFWAGLALMGRRGAFIGAALFGSTILLTSEAHIAKTDAVLCAFTTLSMGALARLYLGEASRRMALVFWLATALGFLIKGPVTPMVSGLAALALVLWGRDWRWLRPLAAWPGPLLFVSLVLPWFLWVQIATGGAYLDGAVGKDLRDKVVGASEGHGGPPGYHLAFLATHFFPATVFLAPALVLLVRRLRAPFAGLEGHTGLRFLAAWAGPTWLVFELLPTKLSHYILPAYPALGLLCGWAVVELGRGERAPVSRGVSLAAFALGAAALLGVSSIWGANAFMREAAGDFQTAADAVVFGAWDGASGFPPWLWIAGAVAALAALVADWSRRTLLAAAMAMTASLLVGWHIRAVFLPSQTWVAATPASLRTLQDVCALPRPEGRPACLRPPAADLRAVGYAEPSFVFEAGTRATIPPRTVVEVPDDPADLPVAYVINLEHSTGPPALAALTAEADAEGRCVGQSAPRYALNYSNGDPVAFVGVRIDADDCGRDGGAVPG